jgi:hypothetical protein
LLNIASTLVGAFLLPYICGIQKTISYEMAIDHIIVERDIIAETLENWMNANKVKPSDALEFLNKNYKL